MSSIGRLMIFASGACLGSLITWKVLEKKYQDIADAEIESVKETYSKREPIRIKDEDKKPNLSEYADKVRQYTSYNEVSKKEEVKEPVKEGPCIISPDEFGEDDDYLKVEMVYYSDHVLVDENGDVVENIDEEIGVDALNHFGEYEEDSIYVRNDEKECYYVVLLDDRKFNEVKRKNPRRVELEE